MTPSHVRKGGIKYRYYLSSPLLHGQPERAGSVARVLTTKGDNKWYLVMNTTKDGLKDAKGFKYDRTNMTWVPDDVPATTGSPPPRQ
jgi:hypothetical protein